MDHFSIAYDSSKKTLKIEEAHIHVRIFDYSQALKDENIFLNKRLVYLLLEQSTAPSENFRAYVGQTDSNGKKRTLDSIKDKGFESTLHKAILFYTNPDTKFTMDQLRYVENRLIGFLKDIFYITLVNSQHGLIEVGEEDENQAKKRLREIEKILFVCGFWFIKGLSEWVENATSNATQSNLPKGKPQVVMSQASLQSDQDFDFSLFPEFEYKFSTKKYPHRKGWVARMKVIGVNQFELQEKSYIEGDDNYRSKTKHGDYHLSYFKQLDPEAKNSRYFNVDEDAELISEDPKHFKTKLKKPHTRPLIYSGCSTLLDIANGRANNGWKAWKTEGGETLEAVNARLGNPLGR
jgi:hypothetical protein